MKLGQGIIVLGRGSGPPGRCPRSYEVFRSKGGIPGGGGNSRFPEWSCLPPPTPVAAPAPAPVITVNPTFTASPAIQTQVSPQISPAFQQVQDSPYAGLRASPQFTSSAPQKADTGNIDAERERIIAENHRIQAERMFEREKLAHEIALRKLDIEAAKEASAQAATDADASARQANLVDFLSTVAEGPVPSDDQTQAPVAPVATSSYSGSTVPSFTPFEANKDELTIPIDYTPTEKADYTLPLIIGGSVLALFVLSKRKGIKR